MPVTAPAVARQRRNPSGVDVSARRSVEESGKRCPTGDEADGVVQRELRAVACSGAHPWSVFEHTGRVTSCLPRPSGTVVAINLRRFAMIRALALLCLLMVLAWSLREAFADLDPKRIRAAAWAMLSGGLIVGGIWMIAADL